MFVHVKFVLLLKKLFVFKDDIKQRVVSVAVDAKFETVILDSTSLCVSDGRRF